MDDSEPLLLSVFNELRSQGVPLGVPEYLLAVETLREGLGLESPDRLRRVCRLLWAKSREDQLLFDIAFERRVGRWLAEPVPASERPPQPPPGPSKEQSREGRPPAEPSAEDESRAAGPEGAGEGAGALGQIPFGAGTAPPQSTDGPPRPWPRYQMTTQLPVSSREMSRIWRQLRRVRREGPPEVLDVQGTIDDISRTGVFVKPVMQPRRRNQVRLLLLIDCLGSMAPFSLIVKSFVKSILRGGLLGQTSIYYFHDAPDAVLYETPGLLRARPLEEVFSARAKGGSVLFLSDAGAARGRYESGRALRTRACVAALRDHTYRYSWLNPLPAARWRHTTAQEVAGFIPMFPLTREGLLDAVNILRGQPFPPGVA